MADYEPKTLVPAEEERVIHLVFHIGTTIIKRVFYSIVTPQTALTAKNRYPRRKLGDEWCHGEKLPSYGKAHCLLQAVVHLKLEVSQLPEHHVHWLIMNIRLPPYKNPTVLIIKDTRIQLWARKKCNIGEHNLSTILHNFTFQHLHLEYLKYFSISRIISKMQNISFDQIHKALKTHRQIY